MNTTPKYPKRRQGGRKRLGLVIRELIVLSMAPMVLLSLLFMGVLQARESARRMTCAGNLKQQTLAMHNFHVLHNHFPPGCSEHLIGAEAFGNSDGRKLYAWSTFVLPYLEYGDVYEQLRAASPSDLERCFTQQASLRSLQTPIATFRCSSDTSAPLVNYGRSFEVAGQGTLALALSSYVGSNGSRDLDMLGGSQGANGIFYWNSATRIENIEDGSSNTIMLGERAWIRERGTKFRGRAAVLYGVRSTLDRSFFGLADGMAGGRFRINFNAVDQPGGLGESYVRRGFSSNHRNGATFAMADGSVRFLLNDMDADMDPATQCTRTPVVDSTFEKLLSINDGQTVSLDE